MQTRRERWPAGVALGHEDVVAARSRIPCSCCTDSSSPKRLCCWRQRSAPSLPWSPISRERSTSRPRRGRGLTADTRLACRFIRRAPAAARRRGRVRRGGGPEPAGSRPLDPAGAGAGGRWGCSRRAGSRSLPAQPVRAEQPEREAGAEGAERSAAGEQSEQERLTRGRACGSSQEPWRRGEATRAPDGFTRAQRARATCTPASSLAEGAAARRETQSGPSARESAGRGSAQRAVATAGAERRSRR